MIKWDDVTPMKYLTFEYIKKMYEFENLSIEFIWVLELVGMRCWN